MNSLYPERKKEKNRNHEKKTSARKYRVFPLAKIDIISDTSNHFHRSFPINPLHREPIAIVHLQLFPIYNPARVHATTPHPSTDVVFFIFFFFIKRLRIKTLRGFTAFSPLRSGRDVGDVAAAAAAFHGRLSRSHARASKQAFFVREID